jgi:Short C-terminal domain
MLNIAMSSMPETLTYSVLAGIGIEVLLAILLAVRGEGLGVVLVLALACVGYWFVCRQLVAVVSARLAVGASGLVLFLCGLIDFAAGHPYFGVLFVVGAVVLGFVFVLLQQGGVLAKIAIAGIVAVGAPNRAAQLRMLEELRDAGLLTEDEFAAKRALVAL